MSRLLGRVIGTVIGMVGVVIPRGIVRTYKHLIAIIEPKFRLTAILLRVFLLQFIIFEGIFQVLPIFFGDSIGNNRTLVGIYNLVTQYQWDKNLCEKVSLYLSNGLLLDIERMDPILICLIIAFSVSLIILLVLVMSIILNIRFIILALIIDLLVFTFKKIKSGLEKGISNKNDRINPILKEAGYLEL